jgi:hypothetical protein
MATSTDEQLRTAAIMKHHRGRSRDRQRFARQRSRGLCLGLGLGVLFRGRDPVGTRFANAPARTAPRS